MTRCIICDSYAAIAPRVSGGISAISSALVIFIILRSKPKFKTIYQRIMFGMSCTDIMSSIAVALSTLPMPKELPYSYESFSGTRIGTIATCEAQGFFFVFGFIAMFTYNLMLCIYYTCAIAFGMKEQKIAKFVEPFLHLTPFVFGLGRAVPALVYKWYNPVSWDAWCSIATGGSEFDSNDGNDNGARNLKNINVYVTFLCGALFLGIIICFGLIISKVWQVDRDLNRCGILRRGSSIRDSELKATKSNHNNMKVILIQCLAYFMSFLISLGILLLSAVIVEPWWMIRLSFVLNPAQGLFNLLIFVGHKIYNYRRVSPDVSRCEVVGLLFRGQVDEPVLFSRVYVSRRNNDGIISELELDDEMGSHHVIEMPPIVEGSETGAEVVNTRSEIYGAEVITARSEIDDLSDFVSSNFPPSENKSCISQGGLSGFSSLQASQACPEIENKSYISRGGLSDFSSLEASQASPEIENK